MCTEIAGSQCRVLQRIWVRHPPRQPVHTCISRISCISICLPSDLKMPISACASFSSFCALASSSASCTGDAAGQEGDGQRGKGK